MSGGRVTGGRAILSRRHHCQWAESKPNCPRFLDMARGSIFSCFALASESGLRFSCVRVMRRLQSIHVTDLLLVVFARDYVIQIRDLRCDAKRSEPGFIKFP